MPSLIYKLYYTFTYMYLNACIFISNLNIIHIIILVYFMLNIGQLIKEIIKSFSANCKLNHIICMSYCLITSHIIIKSRPSVCRKFWHYISLYILGYTCIKFSDHVDHINVTLEYMHFDLRLLFIWTIIARRQKPFLFY